MYVMQAFPSHQQALAGGIFSTIFRLGSAVALGISTAVFSSVKGTGDGMADLMLPYTRAFQVSIALGAASFLFLPFVRVGTQGHARDEDMDSLRRDSETQVGPQAGGGVVLAGKEHS